MSGINYDLSKIKALVFDVDGVLSPSTIPLDNEGNPTRMVNIKDGYAIQLARKLNIPIAIITGARSETIKLRYSALGVEHIYIGADVKIKVFNEWIQSVKLAPEEILYMGDDIPDLECMQMVGIPVCPADACSEVIEASRYVSEFGGGKGAVRDIVEQVLRSQDEWAKDRQGVLGVASR